MDTPTDKRIITLTVRGSDYGPPIAAYRYKDDRWVIRRDDVEPEPGWVSRFYMPHGFVTLTAAGS